MWICIAGRGTMEGKMWIVFWEDWGALRCGEGGRQGNQGVGWLRCLGWREGGAWEFVVVMRYG